MRWPWQKPKNEYPTDNLEQQVPVEIGMGAVIEVGDVGYVQYTGTNDLVLLLWLMQYNNFGSANVANDGRMVIQTSTKPGHPQEDDTVLTVAPGQYVLRVGDQWKVSDDAPA